MVVVQVKRRVHSSSTSIVIDEDPTVIAHSLVDKEPVHQPLSEAAPGSQESNLKPSSDSIEQNVKPKQASITEYFKLGKRKENGVFQEISSQTSNSQQDTKDARASRLHEIEKSGALTVVESQTCFDYESDVWTDPNDITSKDDLLMMLEEFQRRKEVHVCKCGIMYMDHTSFWLHKNNAHKQDNIFACGICSKDCGSSEELQVHLNDTSCERRDAL